MEANSLEAIALPSGTDKFKEWLLTVMDRKDHRSYWRLMGPGTTREQLLVHYKQEWDVYVRDFPVLLSRVHARCPVPAVRRELAANLYEEETGGISGGGPHGELFLRMMDGLGFPPEAFENIKLLSASRAYRRFLDQVTTRSPWVVALAVTTIFVEGSRNDRAEVAPETLPRSGNGSSQSSPAVEDDPLVVNHGLDPRYLELKRVHRKVEGGHRRSAWSAVLQYARTPADRAMVITAVERALDLWLAYREAIARAAKI
jgi:pyrroloquinoline-quinone synthase